MSLTLVKFLYKAADSRNLDMATYGGGGAVAGAGLAGLLNKDDDIKSKLVAMGLGGLAGGALGAGYGANKASVNRTLKSTFTDTHESNPLMTGLGLGALSAGAVGAHDYVTGNQGLNGAEAADTYGLNTLKSHAGGGALNDPTVNKLLGDEVDITKKQQFMSALAQKEDALVADILAGKSVPGVNPVRFQAVRALNAVGLKDKAEVIARREAVRTILEDDTFLEGLKNNITPPTVISDADKTLKTNLETQLDHYRNRRPITHFAPKPPAGHVGTPPGSLEVPDSSELTRAIRDMARRTSNRRTMPGRDELQAMKARISGQESLIKHMQGKYDDAGTRLGELLTALKERTASKPILDTKAFGKNIFENISKAKPSAWKRLGTIGLGAGALGTMAASLENKLYD